MTDRLQHQDDGDFEPSWGRSRQEALTVSGAGGGSLFLATLPLHSFLPPGLQSATIKPQQSDRLDREEETGAARRGRRRLEVRGRERFGGRGTAVGGAAGSRKAGSGAGGGGRGWRRRRAGATRRRQGGYAPG